MSHAQSINHTGNFIVLLVGFKPWSTHKSNPSEIVAKELNNTVENNSLLSEDDFETFCKYKNLPNFDFIGLHGIWSWISASNRSINLLYEI